jgi:hypothetical protein
MGCGCSLQALSGSASSSNAGLKVMGRPFVDRRLFRLHALGVGGIVPSCLIGGGQKVSLSVSSAVFSVKTMRFVFSAPSW